MTRLTRTYVDTGEVRLLKTAAFAK